MAKQYDDISHSNANKENVSFLLAMGSTSLT